MPDRSTMVMISTIASPDLAQKQEPNSRVRASIIRDNVDAHLEMAASHSVSCCNRTATSPTRPRLLLRTAVRPRRVD